MSHPFGDLLSRYLHRKHGLSQSKLAAGILQDPSVITKMCKGQRLVGPQARARVLAIVEWLHTHAAIETATEADALLAAAGMAPLRTDDPGEQALLRQLRPQPLSMPVQPIRPTVSVSRRTNLPAALTSFVGRSQELAEVARIIAAQRLVTLTGAGGVGKTRLAIEVGMWVLESADAPGFADGVWLMELAELVRPALIPQAMARLFALPEHPGRTSLELLEDYLADKHLLLIVDNCEHLVDACAEVVERLVQRCWRLHVLTTSREELRIPGEMIYPVLPLTLPDPLEHDPEQLLGAPAAQLFVERIGARTRHAYREDAATIAHICRQLDGIPLALELAAPLTRSLPLREIAAQLQNQMAVLTNTYRTAVPRHQTMHSALVWSYRLLAPAEQQLLARVSVFAGGWTLDAVQAVCSDTPVAELRRSLHQLVATSLVLPEAGAGQQRYRLLEPVRQFARAQLTASGEYHAVCRRHALYFLGLAEQLGQARDTPQERAWLHQLEVERANIHAVTSWAIEQGECELAHRFNGLLFAFWIYRSSAAEARHWLEAALHLQAVVPTAATLTAEALALDAAGYIAIFQHDFTQARSWFDRELKIHMALNHQAGIASALRGLGFTAMLTNHLEQAQHYTERSLIVSRSVDDRWGAAWSLYDLGYLAFVRGEHGQARVMLEQAIAELQAQGNLYGTLRALNALGYTLRLLGDPERARGQFHAALQIYQHAHYVAHVSDSLEGLAGIAAADDPAGAARLFGAAHAHREAMAAQRWPQLAAIYDRDLTRARRLLDPDEWQIAWAAGCAMPLDHAVADALAARERD